jgi:SSS family solute:Na+ symporter
MSAGLILVTILILHNVGWAKLTGTVTTHYGAGGFNPFAHTKMGWSYVVFNAMQNLAAVLTWQTTIQRLLAAKDTATGRKIYTRTSFFFVCRFLIPGVWGIAALSFIAPDQLGSLFSAAERATMSAKDIFDRGSLLAMPHFLGTAVPVGLMGILVAAMLAADMSTDSSYMLAWGSVIYNDIMAPFHKGRWSDKKGILINRFIVAIIGIFLLFFGLVYQVEGDMWTYLTLTATIYLASMSVLLIACCYWKRANNWGAGAAIIVGAAVPVGYLIMQKVDATRVLAERIGPHNSGIAAFVLTAVAMVIGSLLKPRSSAPAGQLIGGKL